MRKNHRNMGISVRFIRRIVLRNFSNNATTIKILRARNKIIYKKVSASNLPLLNCIIAKKDPSTLILCRRIAIQNSHLYRKTLICKITYS